MQIIMTPFSWLLTAFYNLFDSYGIALILFAIVVKLILFPFSLKGKRSMIQMNMIQGKVQQIQKQYANNREKMNEEVQKLYEKENVKPMSGCLWSFIPLLILWPLYAIIRRPFFYMMGQTTESIEAITNALNFVPTGNAAYSELEMASWINGDNLEAVRAAANSVADGLGSKIFTINFDFLGLDLSQIPQWKFWEVGSFSWSYIGLILLPLISAALGLLMSIISQKTNNMNNKQGDNPASKQMKTMMFISPLISLWIGFMYPAGLCIYWIINNLLSIVQEIVSGRILKKDYERAAAARAEQERLEKEEEKRKKREAAERRARAIEEAKNNKGKKKQKPVEKPEKKKDRTTDVGRIGMRPYARGRSYDPDRYGGVTPYQDPGAPIDEEAVEKALEAKGKLAEAQPDVEVTAEAPEQAEEVVFEAEAVESPEAEEVEETEADALEEDEPSEEDEQSGE